MLCDCYGLLISVPCRPLIPAWQCRQAINRLKTGFKRPYPYLKFLPYTPPSRGCEFAAYFLLKTALQTVNGGGPHHPLVIPEYRRRPGASHSR